MRRLSSLLSAGLIAIALAAPARAHDLWLIPPESVDSPIDILAAVGTEFPLSHHLLDVDKLKSRRLIQPDGSDGKLSTGPATDTATTLRFTPSGDGLYIVAAETTPKIIKLKAADFNAYLVADGLPHIYQLRHDEKSTNQDAVERYQKSPKALIRIGDGKATASRAKTPADATRPLGLPLEIVPLADPFALKPRDTLAVRVLFQTKPLADANLGWDVPGDGIRPTGSVRTNAQGEALIPIAQRGLTTIRLTHMTRPKNAEYEWESFWTTLTFRIP